MYPYLMTPFRVPICEEFWHVDLVAYEVDVSDLCKVKVDPED